MTYSAIAPMWVSPMNSSEVFLLQFWMQYCRLFYIKFFQDVRGRGAGGGEASLLDNGIMYFFSDYLMTFDWWRNPLWKLGKCFLVPHRTKWFSPYCKGKFPLYSQLSVRWNLNLYVRVYHQQQISFLSEPRINLTVREMKTWRAKNRSIVCWRQI